MDATTAATPPAASPARLDHLSKVRSLVVKLGTQLLADKEGRLDTAFLAKIAAQVHALRQRNIQVTIVSSGAIGAGLKELRLPKRPTDLATLQAVAAVGQRKLMDGWADAFEPHGLPVAQLLLTRDDIEHRTRYLNLRNTISAVQALGAVPIINENDTVSTDELIKITFGDNDILAALVTNALQADLLVLLTVVDGVLDDEGNPLRLVSAIQDAKDLVRTEKSALGKGGMNSKVEAARTVTQAGERLVVANGRMDNVLPRLLDGEELGTLFVPGKGKLSSRSRWIGSVRPVATVTVDDGAVRAVTEKNKSLLPAGVTSVNGEFAPGDVIGILSPDGRLVARGLSNYASEDVERIKGKKTPDVRQMFTDPTYEEVIHRDNLVVG